MAIARLGRQAKRSYGFCIKMTAVTVLGLCFVLVWSVFSSSSVVSQRSTFSDIAEPVSSHWKGRDPEIHYNKRVPRKGQVHKEDKKGKVRSHLDHRDKKKVNESSPVSSVHANKGGKRPNAEKKERVKSVSPKKDEEKNHGEVGSEEKELHKEEGEQEDEAEAEAVDKDEEAGDGEGKSKQEIEEDAELLASDGMDQEDKEKLDDDSDHSIRNNKKKKSIGPLFDSRVEYAWKLCSTRSKHNYIPCIDIESTIKRLLSYRHHERSCPKTPPMCLVPLPQDGYNTPVSWPESKFKILYKNVAHPKLATFVKSQSWVVESGEYLTFPQNQSDVNGGFMHYLEFIEEMVPDIEWGKNIRIVMDIGCLDSNFAATLLDKEVLTLTLGLKDDLVDLTQIALERGFPAVVSPLRNRRLPFPSGVFDAIHCRECHVQWHSNGGKLLLEMNRILRPGGYFILSTKHDSIEVEEAMSKLTASICWNILAHKTDDISEVGVKIYQKPESNDIYGLRRKKAPPLCKEYENPDSAWYTAIPICLHNIPSDVEQRGTEWPEEWPKRLHTFPDWMANKEKLIVEIERWEAIVNKTYLTGMGIDWSNIRNVMDMKAINGGFAAALSRHQVWVMNVVPVHAPDTLPVIFERGLAGIYHDWCESFGTYPRSYDLLHADHLFSRLKNRCKQPLAIVVEMDRVLRPGGWVIVREKVEILDPLETIFKSLHWEIRMSFHQDKEGIMSVQKTAWRP